MPASVTSRLATLHVIKSKQKHCYLRNRVLRRKDSLPNAQFKFSIARNSRSVSQYSGIQLEFSRSRAVETKRSGYIGPIRSEERRVGKECRSRWWRYR